VISAKIGSIKISLIKNKVMATKRKIKKHKRPCGEGYERVEIDPSDDPTKERGFKEKDSSTKKKKYKCVKIRKPGIKNPDKETKPNRPEKDDLKGPKESKK